MKRTILCIVILAITVYCGQSLLMQPAKKTIAVVTTLSHPALDNTRDGFNEILSKRWGQDIDVVHYNAEGSVAQANLIAQKIANDRNIIGVFTIGSLASITITKAEKTRPIVFAAVSDPSVLGSIGDNVCGLSDGVDPADQIDVIQRLLPQVKRIALLYTPSEPNAHSSVEALAAILNKVGIDLLRVGVHEPQQILTASASACKNADVVFIPLDNQLVAAMPAVIKATRSLPCVIITSNESPIHDGATIAFGVDYSQSGKSAAAIMNDIIDKKTTPMSVGIIKPSKLDLFMNDRVAREKHLVYNSAAVPDLIHVAGVVNRD